jgi:N-acetylmuramoyl-L-alanine amidase
MTREQLYTIRWYINNSSKEATLEYIASLLNEEKVEQELPSDNDLPASFSVALVVGHEAKSPGAYFKGPEFKHEYDYNSQLAKKITDLAKSANIKVHTVFRDGVGISGAYKKVKELDVDACIELHFNAFNGKATGTVNLCSNDANDKAFATIVQKHMCKAMKRDGLSRGLSITPKRGGQSVHALPGTPNCLVEPFFGDNLEECKLAVEQFDEYAMSLIAACQEYFS